MKIKTIIEDFKKDIYWSNHREEIEKDIKRDTHTIDVQRSEIAKLKQEIKEIEFAQEQNDKYLETIKEQRKEIKQLKKELENTKETLTEEYETQIKELKKEIRQLKRKKD